MIDDWCSMMAGIRSDKQSGALWPHCYIEGWVCPQKPAFLRSISEQMGK
jgi:hypothetical protein